MSYEQLIARRFLKGDKDNFSHPLVRIATYTIALGVVVMIMAVSILRGFQQGIEEKLVGFGAHIVVQNYGWVNEYDVDGITLSTDEVAALERIEGVASVAPFAYKGGMLKTDDQIQGIIFKGVDFGFDSSFFVNNMVCGRFFSLDDSTSSNEVIISQRMASRMGLDTGDKARAYFWAGNNYRARAFKVVGLYNTDLSEFDEHYIVGDIRQVQSLNGWDSGEVAGYEVLVDNFDNLDAVLEEVRYATRPDLAVVSIREQQPSMFAWLELLNSNIVLILLIMAVVCAASVVSALLIMIFEKTSMIGLLKTLGSTNHSIRRIFMLKATVIVGKGIIYGNAASLLLCFLQYRFHIVKLDSESYSMTFVPVDIDPWFFIAVSVGTMLVCLLALLLPSTYIAHIDPAKTVRVE